MSRRFVVIAVLAAMSAAAAHADVSRADQKEIKRILKADRLYLRMDAPCATGRHPYGTYKKPLVEVSPEGSNMDISTTMNVGVFHADSTYWGIRINDPVELDDVDFDDGEIEVELEGVGPAEDIDTVIKFINVSSLDDFRKAFDHAFSTVPLQDQHDDWSAETKKAIADRQLVNGMSKRQVFYIVGSPESFEKKKEGGKEVEIWHLRTDRGVKMGFFTSKAQQSELPSIIRFEDGILTSIGSAGSAQSDGFSIDD